MAALEDCNLYVEVLTEETLGTAEVAASMRVYTRIELIEEVLS